MYFLQIESVKFVCDSHGRARSNFSFHPVYRVHIETYRVLFGIVQRSLLFNEPDQLRPYILDFSIKIFLRRNSRPLAFSRATTRRVLFRATAFATFIHIHVGVPLRSVD